MHVRLDDIDINAKPDSGADVNAMDEHQFKALIHQIAHKPTLQLSKTKLNTLQHPLPVKGEFNTIIRNQTCGRPAKFIIVGGRINSPPLLSLTTLTELGMIAIQPDGSLIAQPNEMRIREREPQIVKLAKADPGEQQMEQIISKYSHVFQGTGEIRDKNQDKDLYGTFHMKPEAIPVAQKPRPVPYHLQRPLQQWLEQGVKEDIFEKVPNTEPITRCSPLGCPTQAQIC